MEDRAKVSVLEEAKAQVLRHRPLPIGVDFDRCDPGVFAFWELYQEKEGFYVSFRRQWKSVHFFLHFVRQDLLPALQTALHRYCRFYAVVEPEGIVPPLPIGTLGDIRSILLLLDSALLRQEGRPTPMEGSSSSLIRDLHVGADLDLENSNEGKERENNEAEELGKPTTLAEGSVALLEALFVPFLEPPADSDEDHVFLVETPEDYFTVTIPYVDMLERPDVAWVEQLAEMGLIDPNKGSRLETGADAAPPGETGSGRRRRHGDGGGVGALGAGRPGAQEAPARPAHGASPVGPRSPMGTQSPSEYHGHRGTVGPPASGAAGEAGPVSMQTSQLPSMARSRSEFVSGTVGRFQAAAAASSPYAPDDSAGARTAAADVASFPFLRVVFINSEFLILGHWDEAAVGRGPADEPDGPADVFQAMGTVLGYTYKYRGELLPYSDEGLDNLEETQPQRREFPVNSFFHFVSLPFTRSIMSIRDLTMMELRTIKDIDKACRYFLPRLGVCAEDEFRIFALYPPACWRFHLHIVPKAYEPPARLGKVISLEEIDHVLSSMITDAPAFGEMTLSFAIDVGHSFYEFWTEAHSDAEASPADGAPRGVVDLPPEEKDGSPYQSLGAGFLRLRGSPAGGGGGGEAGSASRPMNRNELGPAMEASLRGLDFGPGITQQDRDDFQSEHAAGQTQTGSYIAGTLSRSIRAAPQTFPATQSQRLDDNYKSGFGSRRMELAMGRRKEEEEEEVPGGGGAGSDGEGAIPVPPAALVHRPEPRASDLMMERSAAGPPVSAVLSKLPEDVASGLASLPKPAPNEVPLMRECWSAYPHSFEGGIRGALATARFNVLAPDVIIRERPKSGSALSQRSVFIPIHSPWHPNHSSSRSNLVSGPIIESDSAIK